MNNKANNEIMVSIITTTFNSLKFLPLCIKSIQNQTFRNYEHIIINDGSTDNTKDYLNSLKDDHIRVFHLERSGRGPSLNKGLLESKGRYIAILDADDLSISSRLEIQTNILEENPSYDLLASGYSIFNGQSIEDINNSSKYQENPSLSLKKINLKDFIYKNPICHSSVMMRKDIFNKVDIYDQTRNELFDFDLWVRMVISKEVKMYQSDRVLIFRNLHDQQYFESKKRLNYIFQTYRIRKRLLKLINYSYFYQLVMLCVLFYGLLPRFIRKNFMN